MTGRLGDRSESLTANVYLSARASDEVKELQRACSRHLVGHGERTAAELLRELGTDIDMDRYGEGGVVAQLESETAELLAKPAAVFLRPARWLSRRRSGFMPTGAAAPASSPIPPATSIGGRGRG